MKEAFMLGNGAIALGLLEGGCQVVTSYPGTPSSEILPEAVRLIKAENLNTYAEWSTNEKVALDNAFAAAISGKRAACCMKQVGLNVAADSLMSAAYLGTTGALVVISCDDPGPHSSQTEQDTRLMARLAKVPVLDPCNPDRSPEDGLPGPGPLRGVPHPGDPEAGHTGLPRPAEPVLGRAFQQGQARRLREEPGPVGRHPPVPVSAAPGTQPEAFRKSPKDSTA